MLNEATQTRVRVKVCCIGSVEEAGLAIAAGVDALGLVSAMPSGPGVISEAAIAKITAIVPPPISTFLLTSKTDAAQIVAQQKYCKNNVVQLVDHLEQNQCILLKERLPGIGLVQVVHVLDEASVDQALAYANYVDALLLDSGNPNLNVKELGGTGRTHNWVLSREIVRRVNIPVFLAGGLNAGNAAQAVKEVRPFGLDLCSGVRTNGKLDPIKLNSFMQAI